MDLSRIAHVMNVDRLAASCVAVFGTGGTAGLVLNLARCGVGHFKLFDFDVVSPSNVARQHHDMTDVGCAKVAALAAAIRRINPAAIIEVIDQNYLEMNAATLDAHVILSDLLIFGTDRFAAQARGNELALQFNVPAIWIGLYEGGSAGEIIFWHSAIDACFRCLCAKRYAAHEAAQKEGRSLDPSSEGCTIFDVSLVDAIAGMVAVGLLTRGSNDRFGQLIEQLGDRNFIQVQLAPTWDIGGINPVRKYLGIADDCRTFFAWNAVVRADPDHGLPPCEDCVRFRGDFLGNVHGVPIRFRGGRPLGPSRKSKGV